MPPRRQTVTTFWLPLCGAHRKQPIEQRPAARLMVASTSMFMSVGERCGSLETKGPSCEHTGRRACSPAMPCGRAVDLSIHDRRTRAERSAAAGRAGTAATRQLWHLCEKDIRNSAVVSAQARRARVLGGRWNEDASRFVRSLVRLRQRRAPVALRQAAAAGTSGGRAQACRRGRPCPSPFAWKVALRIPLKLLTARTLTNGTLGACNLVRCNLVRPRSVTRFVSRGRGELGDVCVHSSNFWLRQLEIVFGNEKI